jgi:hypothetical protein
MGCLHVLRDLDGDGYASLSCEGGRDCNDDPVTGAAINPDATEICDDGIDNNCDGIADYFDTVTCVPTNDTCATPRVLERSGNYPFSTNGLSDDYTLSCESSGSHPDAVFQFTTTAVRDVAIEIPGSPYNASIELRALSDCDPSADMAGDEIACDLDTSSFGTDTARLEKSNLAPGTYAIIASMPAEGFYSLDLRITSPVPPPREDLCDYSSTPVITASGTFSSAFATLSDDYPNLPCRDRTEAQPEAAYRLSLTRPSDVRLVARGYSDTGFQRDIAMAVVRDCANPSTSSVACDTDNLTTDPAEISFTSMPAGDYWILIEVDEYTFYPVEGYELTASISVPPPPVPGDACGMPLDITTSMQMVDVSALRNDGGLGCGGAGLAYRDAVFQVDVAAESSVTLNTSGGFHLLSLSTDCTDSDTELACTASSAGGAGSITQTLAAGTYFLKVSIPDTTGTITATATITAL